MFPVSAVKFYVEGAVMGEFIFFSSTFFNCAIVYAYLNIICH